MIWTRGANKILDSSLLISAEQAEDPKGRVLADRADHRSDDDLEVPFVEGGLYLRADVGGAC